MGGQRHAPPALPPGKTRYPLYRRLGGPQGRYGRVRKISPTTGIGSPNRPARSKSLYRLRYPGPTTRMCVCVCVCVCVCARTRTRARTTEPRWTPNPTNWNPIGPQHDRPSLWYGPVVFCVTFASIRFHSRMEKITVRFVITTSILLTFWKISRVSTMWPETEEVGSVSAEANGDGEVTVSSARLELKPCLLGGRLATTLLSHGMI